MDQINANDRDGVRPEPTPLLSLALGWGPGEAPPTDALLAWLAERFHPEGCPIEDALEESFLTPARRPVGFKLPLPSPASAPPTCEALASTLAVGSARGLFEGSAEPLWRLDGEAVAWLEVGQAPLQVSIQLHRSLLRWPPLVEEMQRWLLCMALSWPMVRCSVAPELERGAPLVATDVARALALLSEQLYGAACARYQGRPVSPARAQRVRWQHAALTRIGARVRGTPLGSPQAETQVSEGVWDGLLAMGKATTSPSLRFAKVIAADREPVDDSLFQALMLGEDKAGLFKAAFRAIWPGAEGPPLHAARGAPVDLSALEAVLSERNFVRSPLGLEPGLSVLSWEPRVTLGAQAEALLARMAELAPALPFHTAALTLDGCPPALQSCPRLHPDLPPPSLGFVLKGAGHDRLLSRRLLAHGPWRLTRLAQDTSLVQLHALGLPTREALKQAAEGQRWMAEALIPDAPALPARLAVRHDAAEGLLWLEAPEPPLDPDALAHLVGVARALDADPATPARRVAVLFRDEAAARAQLPRLWLREIEVWLDRGEGWQRLDDGFYPSFPRPDWVAREEARG